MNLQVLRKEIEADEGCKYESYRCSEGYPTGGIGHLITEWDELYYSAPLGTSIPEEQVQEWFEKDDEVGDVFNRFQSPEDFAGGGAAENIEAFSP